MGATVILLPSERILVRCGTKHFIVACSQEGNVVVVTNGSDNSGRIGVIWDGGFSGLNAPADSSPSSPLHRTSTQTSPEKPAQVKDDISPVLSGRGPRVVRPKLKNVVPKALPQGRKKND